MRFVVVTGMSGGGKSTALKMLEDIGFYCVDNLPVSLIEKFVELISLPSNEIEKVALGIDVRAGQSFEEVTSILKNLKEKGYAIEILFMQTKEDILIKRYKESRRSHPLSENGRVEIGVRKEKEILGNIKKEADYIIDTSSLLTRELKEELTKIFILNEDYKNLMITFMSFGFKHGMPVDADLVFDVRFLPNPFYIDELKQKTGNDKDVQEYVLSYTEAHLFMDKLEDMLVFLLPNYIKEGKHHLIVGIGCTGGKHRSVTLANEMYTRLQKQDNYGVTVYHRDVNRQGI